MLKKILSLLLCLTVVCSFAACGEPETPPVPQTDELIYDASQPHLIAACDTKLRGIVVFDLDRCEGDFNRLTDPASVVWEWYPEKINDTILASTDGRIADAKLRYSSYLKKDVVIAVSSSGWAGVIDYRSQRMLWEAEIGSSPHSAEMLPNGDLVIACSGGDDWSRNGRLVYVPFSQGETEPTHTIKIPSAHGIQWDPEFEILWVVYYDGIVAVEVQDYNTPNATLCELSGYGATFDSTDSSGHDLSPVYGQPGKYWVTGSKGVWLFDSKTLEMTKQYDRFIYYTGNKVKGISYFPDGTMVQCVAGEGGNTTYDWSTYELRVIYFGVDEKGELLPQRVNANFASAGREFYKVHNFCKDYQ